MTPHGCDLLVIGGGPAGSTLATLVKKYRPEARVILAEKARFPRHHVGESLLPGMIPVLKEMGVFEKIDSAGFPRKFGVVFVWGDDRRPWDADFNNLNLEMLQKHGRLLDTEFSWQVLRSTYDDILLRHAQDCGVEVWQGWRAVAPIEKAGKVTGAILEGPGGERRQVSSRTLADCSGQAGFLSTVKRARRYREDLKSVAAYAYFRGAKWKFEYAGHPDKTKIFVCSVPEGWLWYIPLSRELVSVGLVAKAQHVRRTGRGDLRALFFDSIKRCGEIWPLLSAAELAKGMDPAEPERDFFTAGDWSFESSKGCGEGWLAAGDAAFFLDPLLSSGVMMAHLSGHRAAYTILSQWREKDAVVRKALARDYDRFCREVGGSFLSLIRYWYRHDPNARRWWGKARSGLRARSSVELSDKAAFVAVAAGLTYYFERSYTSQSMIFGSAGVEHSWQWEGTKLELKRWTRQILAIVETGFLKRKPAGMGETERRAALRALPKDAVPVWRLPARKELTFLPSTDGGRLDPIWRLELLRVKSSSPEARAANPRRVLPAAYLDIVARVDGRRSVAEIEQDVLRRSALPADVVEGQVFRILKDLHVLGALDLKSQRRRPKAARAAPSVRSDFRRGEAALRDGDPAAAEVLLSRAQARGGRSPWARALRGEALRHLGRLEDSLAELTQAVEGCSAKPAGRGGLRERLRALDAALEGWWYKDRALVFRAKTLLALERPEEAFRDADEAVRLNPRQSEALVLRAKAAIAAGRHEKAYEDLQRALAIESAGRRGEG